MGDRKMWRKNQPQGFVAKPLNMPDGAQDILNWQVVIPGKEGTIWEGARIPMTMQFSEDYPDQPPVCTFKLIASQPLFHPNVNPVGLIWHPLLDAHEAWKPSLTIKHLLLGIQTMLHDPSNAGPVQEKPYHAFKNDKKHYEETVKEQVRLLA